MGRLGAAVHGMGLAPEVSRLYRQLAAVRSTGRAPAVQRRAGSDYGPDRPVLRSVGLADSILDQHCSRGSRVVDTAGRARDADLRARARGAANFARARGGRAAAPVARSASYVFDSHRSASAL